MLIVRGLNLFDNFHQHTVRKKLPLYFMVLPAVRGGLPVISKMSSSQISEGGDAENDMAEYRDAAASIASAHGCGDDVWIQNNALRVQVEYLRKVILDTATKADGDGALALHIYWMSWLNGASV